VRDVHGHRICISFHLRARRRAHAAIYSKLFDLISCHINVIARALARSNPPVVEIFQLKGRLPRRQSTHLPWRAVPGRAAARNTCTVRTLALAGGARECRCDIDL
jgi:hypothetical protein